MNDMRERFEKWLTEAKVLPTITTHERMWLAWQAAWTQAQSQQEMDSLKFECQSCGRKYPDDERPCCCGGLDGLARWPNPSATPKK